MQVKVYFNLHKKVWSVLHKTPKGWRLHSHMQSLLLDDVTWKVSEAGRQRVLREQRKNVHAFAIGTLYSQTWARVHEDWKPVRYNPYEGAFFQVEGKPVTHSEQARFEQDRKVFACQNS